MKGDFWEDSDQVFVHHGKRYGINACGRTILIDPATIEVDPRINGQTVDKNSVDSPPSPQRDGTDKFLGP
jgi:hypothetical protein